MSFGFVYLDDNALIVNRVGEMDKLSKIKSFVFKPVFEENSSNFYRPVLNISLLIDTVISGGEAGFYHYSNVMMHIAAVFLLLLFFKELGYSDIVSFAIAILFAVHPALTSAVAWIPGRNDIILAIFLLPAFIFFIKSLKTGKSLHFLFTAFFLLAALFTKETALIMPFLFIAYIFLYTKKSIFYKKTIIFTAASIIVPVLLYGLFRFITLSQSDHGLSFIQTAYKLISSSVMNIWYLGIISLTDKVILFPQLNLALPDFINGIIPLIIIVILCLRFRKTINFKYILFGLVWFILFITPTYSVASSIYHIHRLYIPIIGIFIILTEISLGIYSTKPQINKFFYPALLLLIIFMSFTSYKQSFFYKNRAGFWFKAYEENPSSPIINTGVSKYYSSINDFENAEKYILQAIDAQKNKDSSALIPQLALIKFNQGDFEQSKTLYEKVLSSASRYDEHSYIGLSKVYESLNDMENALKTINEGLNIMPESSILKRYIRVLNNEETEKEEYVIVMEYR